MQRYSAKREAILNCLNMTDSHPTAEWIYKQVHKKYPSMSFATVYRNLKQMKEEELINSVGFVDNHERFDGCVKQHSHFICEKCGKVFDISVEYDESLDHKKTKEGFVVNSHQMVFKGLCPKCNKNN